MSDPVAENQRSDAILVIKLGALGDIVLATGPFAALRRHHAGARLILLTTAPFADWLRASPWFDEVWIDDRPPWWQIGGWWALRQRLRSAGFRRIYDLQTSSRSSRYFQLLGPGRRPEWSGIAPGCSHPDADPNRNHLHTIDRQRGQLAAAGIPDVPLPDLTWCDADLSGFGLGADLALLVPGGSAHRPEKRWPLAAFQDLAARLAAQGLTPLVLGGPGERDLADAIVAAVPAARSLAGQTGFTQVAALGRRAKLAIGNDTGPMHILAAAGCRSAVLFGSASNPDLCAPRGDHVTVLRVPDLAGLSVETVMAAL